MQRRERRISTITKTHTPETATDAKRCIRQTTTATTATTAAAITCLDLSLDASNGRKKSCNIDLFSLPINHFR